MYATATSGRLGTRLPALEFHALLERLEAWATLIVEPDDLAVEDRVAISKLGAEGKQLRVALRHLDLVPRHDPELAGLDEGERPDAVPFHLIGPSGVVFGQRARELGEHGRYPLRHCVDHGRRAYAWKPLYSSR